MEVRADLYDFLKEQECHLYVKDKNIEVWCIVEFYKLDEFVKLVGEYHFEEGGMECNLLDTYIGIDIYGVIEGDGHYVSSYKNAFDEDEWKRNGSEIIKIESR